MGFEQVQNIREYTFHRVATGEETIIFVISTEVALFLKHHVGLQDGPVMCLRKLTAELEAQAVEPVEVPALRQALTDQDMLGYIAARGLFASKKQGPKSRSKTLPAAPPPLRRAPWPQA